jgi:hypothetical protein
MVSPAALEKLKVLVPKFRKFQRPWPPVGEWPTLLVGVLNSEAAPNKRGLVIRSAGIWADAERELPVDLHHEGILKIGVLRERWCKGGLLWTEVAAPPPGVDVLVDQVRTAVDQHLATGRPVYLSMETTDHLLAGSAVLSAKLLSAALLLGDRPGGVPGAQAYGDGGQRRGLSPAAARLLAEAERAEDVRLAAAWRAGNARMGWRT